MGVIEEAVGIKETGLTMGGLGSGVNKTCGDRT